VDDGLLLTGVGLELVDERGVEGSTVDVGAPQDGGSTSGEDSSFGRGHGGVASEEAAENGGGEDGAERTTDNRGEARVLDWHVELPCGEKSRQPEPACSGT
jgi:hypothetical protein